jgi:hypothetical protein
MNSFHSYSQIFNLGHKAIADLLKVPVYVEEKIDGSQFSFGLTEEGEIKVRSRSCELVVDAPEKMFTFAVDTVKKLKPMLHPGWTYRGEYLRSPKHNALIYSRIPKDHIIIFDIEIGECEFLEYPAKWAEAQRLGLEVVPLLWSGPIETIETFREFLQIDSILGGQKIEGVVIKPIGYNLFGVDNKVLMGKFVSEAFKEVHSKMWKTSNLTAGDILAMLGATYCTQARWQKALQHLTERGLITCSPQDIGALMKEVPIDIKRECEDEIKEKLFAFAWPHISRMVVRNLPAWYKELLLKKQFEGESNEKTTDGEASSDSSTQDMHQTQP